MAVTALLPMKGHSARVPGKNLRPMCGRPLYHWVALALQNAKSVGRIVVETDSDKIEQDVRQNFPAFTVLRRPEELQGDEVPMNLVLENAMRQLGDALYLQTHSTNPLLTSASIDRAVGLYLEPGTHDSLFSVTVWRTRFFWSDGRPVNHNPDELLPTQDLPPLLEENSNIYVFTPQSFALRHHRIGKVPRLFQMDYREALDIDEMHHFDMAEAILERQLRPRAD
ncbi:acylneuraminate cytidylyltransferase family protein [soil metagenome]